MDLQTLNFACECGSKVTSSNLEIWVPAVVSVVTLLVNLLFYIFVQPNISEEITSKQELRKVSVALLNYLSEIVSYTDFSGVPTQIRKYSLQIHLLFKSGVADEETSKHLEEVYQSVQRRKKIVDQDEITEWEKTFRTLVHDLRIDLAKHCGTIKSKNNKDSNN